MDDWFGWYKFARLALLALALTGVAVYLFRRSQKERFEAPARRMLEEDDG